MGNKIIPTRRSSIASDISKGSTVDIKSGFCNADPITKKGKQIQTVQMLVIPLIPIVILLGQAIICLARSISAKNFTEKAYEETLVVIEYGNTIDSITKEKDLVIEYLDGHVSKGNLTSRFEITTKVMSKITIWSLKGIYEDRLAVRSQLQQVHFVIMNGSLSKEQVFVFYDDLVNEFSIAITILSKNVDNTKIWRDLLSYKFLIKMQKNFDIALYFGKQSFFNRSDTYFVQNYIKYNFLAFSQVEVSKEISSILTAEIEKHNLMEKELMDEIMYFNVKMSNETSIISYEEFLKWKKNVKEVLIGIEKLTQTIRDYILKVSKDAKSNNNVQLGGVSFLFAIVLLLGPIVIILIDKITATIHNYALGLSGKTKELRMEKKRSDELLYQMLPKSVALQLKLSKRVSAESFNSVTIYFSDIVGFTSISAKSSPMQVIQFLNSLYYFFDTAIDRYDAYKVETIGDAYMNVKICDIRLIRKRHVSEISSLSLDLLNGIKEFDIQHLPEETLRLRIGIHTGPVVAGVVGSKMPRYCLFGDTVNIANIMEATGVPMKIHISEDTMKCLESFGGYLTEERSEREIPGKGRMMTHFLKGKMDTRSSKNRGIISATRSKNRETPLTEVVLSNGRTIDN
ncbi:DgyrCDS1046 [Dimorphilus gyrociliatus]|uniref:guanylate cyclase n=1 Tax=Dimorphilus gyrociliatus TaxID=2664684 RepID=A0A7I8V854_9ANNE|nr:DgyrCDS1046 [Dimorphilus gyrociliatus]